MSLEIGRRVFIASLFGAPASCIITHHLNRNAAINETVKKREDHLKQNGKLMDPQKVTNTYDSAYWRKVGLALPVNITAGVAVSFIVNKVNNPLTSSLQELEDEIPDQHDRPAKFRDPKIFAKRVSRRSMLDESMKFAAIGSIFGLLFATCLDRTDRTSTINAIHGKMQKNGNNGIERRERYRTQDSLFLQDSLAYMLGAGGIAGIASHTFILSEHANEVKDEIEKHRIEKGLATVNTHILFNERTMSDLREILPNVLKVPEAELEIELHRNGETLKHRIIYKENGVLGKFYITNGKAEDTLQDTKIPLNDGDTVTIKVIRYKN